MRILYVGKHGQHRSNDDEGAVTHALQVLGHEVRAVQETDVGRAEVRARGCRLLLFHGFRNPADLAAAFPDVPKVCWYFDLVDSGDPTLAKRDEIRRQWAESVASVADLLFFTDGDWAAKGPAGKTFWLTQGADERVAGLIPEAEAGRRREVTPVLFTGIRRGGGQVRESFLDALSARYGSKLFMIERGVYRERLRSMIAHSTVVVAPDGPVTDRYWSNRVYLSLGFAAFLVHPLCRDLTRHYRHPEEVVYYTDRDNLYSKIDWALANRAAAREIAEAGLARTLAEHTYRHRVEELLKTVKERLGVC